MRVCLVGSIPSNVLESMNSKGAGIETVSDNFSEVIDLASSGEYSKIVLISSDQISWTSNEGQLSILCSSRHSNTKIVIFIHESIGLSIPTSEWIEIVRLTGGVKPSLIVEFCKAGNPMMEIISTREEIIPLKKVVTEESSASIPRESAKVVGLVGLEKGAGVSLLCANIALATSARGANIQFVSKDSSIRPRVDRISGHGYTEDGYMRYNNSYWKVEESKEVLGNLHADLVLMDLGDSKPEDSGIDELIVVIDCQTMSLEKMESVQQLSQFRIIWNNVNSYILGKVREYIKEEDMVVPAFSSELMSKSNWEKEFLHMMMECPSSVKEEFRNLSRRLLGV